MEPNIIAIDPGKFRTGIVVLTKDGDAIERKIVKTAVLDEELASFCSKYLIDLILIGNGGPAKVIEKKIASQNIKATVIFVNEKGSTLEARKLYWSYNKPRGLMRLIPSSLRIPHEPYDDYAALVIGLRFLSADKK